MTAPSTDPAGPASDGTSLTSETLPASMSHLVAQPAGGSSTLKAETIPTRLLTIPEVHEMCALSEKTIRRAIQRGELPAMKLCNRMRIAPEDLVAWQQQHQVYPRDVVGDDLYRRPRTRRPVTEGGMRELLQQHEETNQP